jgi:processive 1,2-diacylglycerol beta-glucosyltransferase
MNMSLSTAADSPGCRKRVLVLISQGGGGHQTAGDSLREILEGEFDVSVQNVIADILRPLDPLNRLTSGRFTGEDLYNFFLKRHHSRIIQWMATVGPQRIFQGKKLEKAFDRYLQRSTALPDLIISTTPFVNLGIACVAKRWDIPLLIVPTDLDGSTFVQGFPISIFSHGVKIALAYNDADLQQITFRGAPVAEEQIFITGFPVRPACLKKYTEADLRLLRTKHGLLADHHTVTLLMGALGGNLIFEHTEVLSAFDPDLHALPLQINVCVGHNYQIGMKIASFLRSKGAMAIGKQSYRLPSGLVMHLRGFTKEILEIMAVSDLVVTKTGSCTVNEAIYLGKPLLLDNTASSTARHLWWEKFNIPFVQKHNLGLAFTDSRHLHMLIPSLLKYRDKKGKKKLELPNFAQNIQKVVRQMVN